MRVIGFFLRVGLMVGVLTGLFALLDDGSPRARHERGRRGDDGHAGAEARRQDAALWHLHVLCRG